jgi:hypothetical protein
VRRGRANAGVVAFTHSVRQVDPRAPCSAERERGVAGNWIWRCRGFGGLEKEAEKLRMMCDIFDRQSPQVKAAKDA